MIIIASACHSVVLDTSGSFCLLLTGMYHPAEHGQYYPGQQTSYLQQQQQQVLNSRSPYMAAGALLYSKDILEPPLQRRGDTSLLARLIQSPFATCWALTLNDMYQLLPSATYEQHAKQRPSSRFTSLDAGNAQGFLDYRSFLVNVCELAWTEAVLAWLEINACAIYPHSAEPDLGASAGMEPPSCLCFCPTSLCAHSRRTWASCLLCLPVHWPAF